MQIERLTPPGGGGRNIEHDRIALEFGLDRHGKQLDYSPFMRLFRHEWRRLRADSTVMLSDRELRQLQGQNENLSLAEVQDIYLPLSRLLNLYVLSSQKLHAATSDFLGKPTAKMPYIIGMAGSVAVGKSTTARILKALLSRWSNHPKVDLITTDGYLYSNRELEQRGLIMRKGFPESYNLRDLIEFLSDVKAGRPHLKIPMYSHHSYDVIPGAFMEINQPDIVIVEGLNVLQTGLTAQGTLPQVFVSDFFDFTIYVDADADVIRNFYIDRFMTFREKSMEDSKSFFHRFAKMDYAEALSHAHRVWSEINEVNLLENILPTRERAQLVLDKAADHSVQNVYLRKL